MKKPAYRYRAKITKVLDGDTIEADVDVGFDVVVRTKFRLHGIDTPEKSSTDPMLKLLAESATTYTKLYLNKEVVIESLSKDKFGRWLGVIHLGELNLNEELVKLGFAKSYQGESKQGLWEQK